MIEYIAHNEIDPKRWDNCIMQSANRLPYALSWWLDAVCPEWDALVEDNYRSVMPLAQGRKFGINYLYQPYFAQQLGIFSSTDPNPKTIREFLDAIPSNYLYIWLQLNPGNRVDQDDFTLSARKNYLLDLTPSVMELAGNYHRNCRRNIQKAIHAGLTVKQGPGPALFARFIQQNLDKKLTDIRKSFYPSLFRVTLASMQHAVGEIQGVYNGTGELLAAGWFITTMDRCLFQVCASTPKGKENQAMYLLVDHMIRKNAGTGLIFDFAGSNAQGIAYFNSGFGARETYYPVLHRNNLPWPLSLLKR